MSEIELHTGTEFCDNDTFNRIARQQELSVVIAKASIFDDICQAVELPKDLEAKLVQAYLQQEELNTDDELKNYLELRGWQEDDLIYVATKGQRIQQFQEQMFSQEVELNYLGRKLDLDQVRYSLISVPDSDHAFELHQRLQEGEADLEDLVAIKPGDHAAALTSGRYGLQSIHAAHPSLVSRLRVGQPGQLWPPFFTDPLWTILRLDERQGAPLDDALYEQLLDELFAQWLNTRISKLLTGETPEPLHANLLKVGTHDEPLLSSDADQEEAEISNDAAQKQASANTNPSAKEPLQTAQVAEWIMQGNCLPAIPWAEQIKDQEHSNYEHLLMSIFFRNRGKQKAAQQHVTGMMDNNIFDAYVSMIASQCFDLDLDSAQTTAARALAVEIRKETIWNHRQRSYLKDVSTTIQHASTARQIAKRRQTLTPCHYNIPGHDSPLTSPGFTEESPLEIDCHNAVFSCQSGLWIDQDRHGVIDNLLHPSHDFRGFIGYGSPELHAATQDSPNNNLFTIDTPSIYIDFNPHFGHFITHSCAFAIPLLASEEIQNRYSSHELTLLSTSAMPEWATSMLQAAVKTPLTFVQIPRDCDGVAARALITAPPSWIEWHYCNSNHRDLFQAISSGLTNSSPAGLAHSTDLDAISNKIYLSRSRVEHGLRLSVNEHVLEQHLHQRGFSIIHPQELPTTDLIAILSQANVVAGPSGSAMHNILFAHNQAQMSTLNFTHQLAYNAIMLENICGIANNYHCFSTREETENGRQMLYFDIDACLEATELVVSQL